MWTAELSLPLFINVLFLSSAVSLVEAAAEICTRSDTRASVRSSTGAGDQVWPTAGVGWGWGQILQTKLGQVFVCGAALCRDQERIEQALLEGHCCLKYPHRPRPKVLTHTKYILNHSVSNCRSNLVNPFGQVCVETTASYEDNKYRTEGTEEVWKGHKWGLRKPTWVQRKKTASSQRNENQTIGRTLEFYTIY